MSRIETDKKLKARYNAINDINQTGFPNLDMNHLKYYPIEVFLSELPNFSIYELLHKNCWEYNNSIALIYYGREITYRELLDRINKYYNAFKNMGIKEDEIVTIAAPYLPEIIYSIYALNRIGAVINLIDYNDSEEKIVESLNKVQSSKLIMLDIAYNKFDKLIKETKVEKVYTVSMLDSLSFEQKIKFLISNINKNINYSVENDIYSPLIKEVAKNNEIKGKNTYIDSYNDEKDKKVAIIINDDKMIKLTNESINKVAINYSVSDMFFNEGDKFLNLLPNHLAFNFSILHSTLSLGVANIINPVYIRDNISSLIKYERPEHIIGDKLSYQNLREEDKKIDLSYVKNVLIFDDRMDFATTKKINKFLEKNKCKKSLKKISEISEKTGLVAIESSEQYDEILTSLIPPYYSTIHILREDGKYLKNNEIGGIFISGPTLTIENNNGNLLKTDNIGYVDDDGYINILTNKNRAIFKDNKDKVWPYKIENAIMRHPYVKDCICVGIDDKEVGMVPVAFVLIEKNYEHLTEIIVNNDLKGARSLRLVNKDLPYDIIALKEFPLTKSGKINYEELINIYENKELVRKR